MRKIIFNVLLIGLMAVSVARGQGILGPPINRNAPDGILVNDPNHISQNACDGNFGEAMNMTQDDNTGNIGIGTCSWQANLTIQSFGGAYNTAEIVEQSDIYGTLSRTTANLLLVHTVTQPGLGFAGLTPPAVDQPLLVVNAPLQSVGIGMYTPLAMLHINNINAGNPAPSGSNSIFGTGSIGSSSLLGSVGTLTPALWVQNTTGGTTTDALYVSASGLVGIDNSSPNFPLDVTGSANITGFAMIGTPSSGAPLSTPSGYSLYVANGVLAEKYKCALSNTSEWVDYVFDKDYKLRDLKEVQDYISKNHHLPEVPSTEDVHCNGVDLEQMDVALLKKIEELMLYVLDLKKENTQMKAEIANLKK